MASHTIEKPLHIGKTDTYSLTVSDDWLNGEAISSVIVTTDTDYIALGAESIVGNIIYVYLTGVSTSTGDGSRVHFDYATPTRTDCDYIKVKVKDC